jgi:phage shock protein PspC (stress-responsive transcriptional regulator)
MTQPQKRKLTRSREHYVMGGVCAGLAEFLGWSRSRVRWLFVLSCLIPGPQFILYLILWYVVPNEPKRGS